MARFGLNDDPTQIGELRHGSFPAEAAVATRFDSAEWHLRLVMNCGPVDMAHPRLNLFRDLEGASNIAAEDGGREAILGVVGDADSVCFILGANDRDLRFSIFKPGFDSR